MFRPFALAAIALLTATPAFALCDAMPEQASTGYSLNNVERSLCLQRELAGDAGYRADLRKFEMELQSFQLQIQVDRFRDLPTVTYR